MAQEISPQQWFEIEAPGVDPSLRDWLLSTASRPDGAYTLANELPKKFDPDAIATGGKGSPQRAWEVIGALYLNLNRPYDAIAVFDSLYRHMLKCQIDKKQWVHKGMLLCWISDAFFPFAIPFMPRGI